MPRDTLQNQHQHQTSCQPQVLKVLGAGPNKEKPAPKPPSNSHDTGAVDPSASALPHEAMPLTRPSSDE
ncbi:hypothetical protein MHYP_G00177900 [Metynnis hypsauchen]